MKRPARVPASTAVRMNSASNRMAKWYQKAIMALPPMTLVTGSAPCRRPASARRRRATRMVLSPTSLAVCVSISGVIDEAPARDGLRPPLSAWCRSARPGCSWRSRRPARAAQAATSAMIATKRFHQHAAVADEARVRLVLEHLRRGARGDQRVEARDGAAGDGDEQEREQRCPTTPGPCRRRTASPPASAASGMTITMPIASADDGADLEEGREVVARRQQQPHRQDRGDEAVADQHPGQRLAGEGEQRRPGRALRAPPGRRRSPASAARSRSPRSRRSGPGGCSACRRP